MVWCAYFVGLLVDITARIYGCVWDLNSTNKSYNYTKKASRTVSPKKIKFDIRFSVSKGKLWSLMEFNGHLICLCIVICQ